MKAFVEKLQPDGTRAQFPLYGVDLFPEKRYLKKAYRPLVIGTAPDGTPITDEDTPAHEARLEEMHRKLNWGERVENIVPAHYSVRISLLGQIRHVGTEKTPHAAGRLFDSALFHLWGFITHPLPRFNFYREGDPIPDKTPKILDLRWKIGDAAINKGLDPHAFDYTFLQRNDF